MNEAQPLLVPVELHAMAVNGRPRNFRRSQYHDGHEPVSEQFQYDIEFHKNKENQGVYLMWTLPKALRHGYQKEGTVNVEFPLVPNRWLVVRYSGPLENRIMTAWIIESDYLDSKGSHGSFYPDPFAKEPKLVQIGRKLPLTDWSENNKNPLFLRAISPGNLMFSAYQPTCQNVFSFHDDLTTQGIVEDNLSYLVIGWYSDIAADPLNQWPKDAPENSFADILSRLKWVVQNRYSGTAHRSLYHGMISGVHWKQGTEAIPSLCPDIDKSGDKIKVAVGNTDIEALIALLKHQGAAENKAGNPQLSLLETFLYDLLHYFNEPGGQSVINQKILEAGYTYEPGGIIWEIVDLTGQAGQSAPVNLPPEQLAKEQQWLAELNAAQAELEKKERLLHTWQQDLYELWWKDDRAEALRKHDHQNPQNCPTEKFETVFKSEDPNSLVSRIDNLLDEIAALKRKIPFETNDKPLAQAIHDFAESKGISQSRCLQATADNHFRQPGDPVILIAGVNRGPAVDINDTLPCRMADEVISQITLNDLKIQRDQITGILNRPDLNKLPGDITPAVNFLIQEFLILDPLNARAIACNILKDEQLAPKLADCMGPNLKPIAGEKLPYINLSAWSQPWLPLYLEWEVEWHPVPYSQNGNDYWELGNKDFHWKGPTDLKTATITISGWSLLTPKTTSIFKSRLSRFFNDHPEAGADGGNLMAEVEKWDFLSQTLHGFNTHLALRYPSGSPSLPNKALHFPSGRTMIDLTGNRHYFVPKTGPIILIPRDTPILDPDNPTLSDNLPESTVQSTATDTIETPHVEFVKSNFEGMRCGQFIFRRITIIDRFGQTAEVLTGQNSETFHPIIADSLKPEQYVLAGETKRLIELKPRLLQNSRLNFSWISNADDSKNITPGNDHNPICGWLIPDHMDRALAVFDPDGMSLGDIFVGVNPDGKKTVQWEPAPGGQCRTCSEVTTVNTHLGGFLSSLQNQEARALEDLSQIIDETLWLANSTPAQTDQRLAALFGRPLALVRAKLQLELQEGPLSDPAWEYTFNPQSALFTGYSFLVRLGDALNYQDGFIGYFLGNDYSEFHFLHDPGFLKEQPYLKKIQPPNCISLQFRPESVIWVTLLIDPRLMVHAQTGLLPPQDISVPARFIGPALDRMEFTFHASPLLTYFETVINKTPNGEEQETRLLLPGPADFANGWSWLEKSADNHWPETAIGGTDQTARFRKTPPVIREGFLKIRQLVAEKRRE